MALPPFIKLYLGAPMPTVQETKNYLENKYKFKEEHVDDSRTYGYKYEDNLKKYSYYSNNSLSEPMNNCSAMAFENEPENCKYRIHTGKENNCLSLWSNSINLIQSFQFDDEKLGLINVKDENCNGRIDSGEAWYYDHTDQECPKRFLF